MLNKLVHHPRRLWLRKALFQIHLWLGVLLSLYVVVIGLSGATLVFEDEIRRASMQHVLFDESRIAPVATVIDRVHRSFPKSKLTFVTPPQKDNPRWALYLKDNDGKPRIIYADIFSGAPDIQGGKLFIDYVLDLHVNLLMGETGFVVNCVAGIGLLILAITGAALWWPGVKLWTRGLFVSLRRGWKRINYDTHNAIGIWTLFIVSWWGITAVYFLFPAKVSGLVNAVAPLVSMKKPEAPAETSSTAVARLEDMLISRQTISPGYLSGIALPEKPGGNVTIYVDRFSPGDFSHRDIDTFDGHSGKLLTVWHYGDNKSLGDWIVWLMYPLHFGTLWGVPIKILWSLLGLSLAVLSTTGLLMYWNRYLAKRWRSLHS
jgi:uncharacterized iron-regulated membrane protein